jgi:hypothetical protein
LNNKTIKAMFNKQYSNTQHLTPLSFGEGLGVRSIFNNYKPLLWRGWGMVL